jgi:hypothetical protein
VRRKSSINREKRLNLAERARRMTPEERLKAAANLSHAMKEIERAGKRHREGNARKERS